MIDEDTLYVEVLSSESTATSTGSEAETTGATIDVGDGSLFLQLLHAQTSSEGEGSSAIAIINDQGILTSDQVDGQCEIPADPLANILCLYADATGEGAGDASVGDAELADGNITGDLFQASAAPAAGPDDEVSGGTLPDDDGDDTTAAADGTLPRTGAGLGLLGIGLGLLGAGAGLDRFRRRN